MKRLVVIAAALALLAVARPADAGVLELDAQIQAGGMAGIGLHGDAEPFHESAKGLGFGGLVGVEFLFFDGWIEHNQYYNDHPEKGRGINGTWTQFMFGADIQFDIGDTRVDAKPGKPDSGYSKGFGELGFGIGYGVGTGQQVDPPLDRTEVTHQGFLAQVHLDFGYRLTKVLSIGMHIPVQVGYILPDDSETVTANCTECWYSSIQGAALVTMRMNFSLTR